MEKTGKREEGKCMICKGPAEPGKKYVNVVWKVWRFVIWKIIWREKQWVKFTERTVQTLLNKENLWYNLKEKV